MSPVNYILRFCLENKLLVFLGLILFIVWGLLVAPFDWKIGGLPRNPVPVDAIPDIGENQQIVFTKWMGRSPQDVEDQITYPLTVALLGLPEVKTVRSYSYFGFSSIYVIFNEKAEFYWSRSRILEKLNSLPPDTLPGGVAPALGPDATGLGQVYWYTLEGRDKKGNPASGWDTQDLRSIQDFNVRYALQSVDGVSEVASIGGFVKEYQIDVDPDAMRAHGVTLSRVFDAVRMSNLDVGARTIEINKAEYVIRGLGFVKNLKDLREIVIRAKDGVPLTLDQIANIHRGPALRRGALDKGGAEAVGGVVVVRYGTNPLETIQRVKEKIEEISHGLPEKILADGSTSKVTVVPFYDRSGLIHETLETLNTALKEEVLVTCIVVILIVLHLRSSILIAMMLPLAILFTFIGMKLFKVDANIVALSGIAIAIGTIVDMGIVICENILRHLQKAGPEESRLEVVYRASAEVGGAVLTAVLTTVISFLPVFAMEGAEGKLFRPLAWTKSFALISSIIIALAILPPLAHLFFSSRKKAKPLTKTRKRTLHFFNYFVAFVVAIFLARSWLPLGPEKGVFNEVFVIILLGGLLLFFMLFIRIYPMLLAQVLNQKTVFLSGVCGILLLGGFSWKSLSKEFMPSLNEGSFLFMPSTMPHASIGEAMDVMQIQDKAISSIPEVETVVGKLGRVESPLDPAPISMFETVIQYLPEYGTDENGKRFRQWRDHIRSPDDIWKEIIAVTELPGTTSAPKLQPIETRLIMLQTGMRAPMGLKIRGPDLKTIETVGLEIERLLKEVPMIEASTVFSDRIVGKPYLEIDIDRKAIARHGIHIKTVQDVIEVAVGGKQITTTVEGRERYPVRVRYQRELRDSIESLSGILIPTPDGTQIPLRQLAEIEYLRGPQAIKSEDTFLTGYVIFDRKPEVSEVAAVEAAERFLNLQKEKGEFIIPAGVSYRFTGSYENQIRASKKLMLVVPLAIFLIFMLIWFQFKRISTTLIIFSGILIACSGGFIMLWLYGQGWFLDFPVFGIEMRDLFQIRTVNLSIAVWVGFIALFGIATDDGVLMGTYLTQRFSEKTPQSIEAIREATLTAAIRRNRPAMMTTATTLLALLPILTSSGRGSDVMIPMAIPSFGGMSVAILTVFVVPTLFCLVEETRFKRNLRKNRTNAKTII